MTNPGCSHVQRDFNEEWMMGDGKCAGAGDSPSNGEVTSAALMAGEQGGAQAVEESLLRLQQSDLEMIRVLEDLIYLLIHKGVVRITDLPEAAQAKLIDRSRARDALGGLTGLINDEEEQGLI